MNIIKIIFGFVFILIAVSITYSLKYMWDKTFKNKYFWMHVLTNIIIWTIGIALIFSART